MLSPSSDRDRVSPFAEHDGRADDVTLPGEEITSLPRKQSPGRHPSRLSRSEGGERHDRLGGKSRTRENDKIESGRSARCCRLARFRGAAESEFVYVVPGVEPRFPYT